MADTLKALILDFDGVILESNDLKTQAFVSVFNRFPEHADAMMAYHRAHVSDTRFVKFRHLVHERLGRPDDEALVQELADAFSRETRRLLATCPLVPGAEAFLQAASARVPVYLASVTPQAELEDLLEARHLRRYFTKVYGCPPWTKASAVGDILAGLGGPAHVLFIGDSAGDQRAAAANSVEFLARDSGLPFDVPVPPSFPNMTAMAHAIRHRLPHEGQGLL
jgi:phosphoglycolate phosphatase-like HAD superfamily hydrolase